MDSQDRRASATDGRRRCVGCSAPLAADNTAPLCGRCHREQRDQLSTPPVQRDEFWTTEEFQAASDNKDIGRILRAYRMHPRHIRLFGKPLNQELLGRWLGLTQAQVSKLENGKSEQNLENLTTYARILHIPQDLLWFDLPGQTRIAQRKAQLTPTGSFYIATPHSLDAVSAPAGSIITSSDPLLHIGRLVDARAHFERMYRNSGGLVAGIRIEQFLARRALPYIVGASGNGSAETKSKRAVGSLIALAGVCAYDSEDWEAANSHFAQALAIAGATDDYGFHAYVLALMVNQALALEDYQAAERMADVALRSCRKAPATPLSIDLQVMRAKALASMGDASGAMSLIRKLETNVSKLPAGNGIAEASYAQQGHLQAQLAEALISLGELGAAHRYAEQSLASEGHARGKVNRLASMATLEVSRGELERASFLVCEMIDSAQGMESRRLSRRFLKLRAALASGSATASREAIDRIDSAIILLP